MGTAHRTGDTIEAVEKLRQRFRRNAGTGIRDQQFGACVYRAQLDAYFALQRVLECVRQQIQDDLFPHLPIDKVRFRKGVTRDGKANARALHGGTKDTRQLLRQGGKIGRHEMRLRASCLNTREIEQGIDEPQQPQRIAVGTVKRLAAQPLRRVLLRLLYRTQQQRERGPEFMRDVGEEGGLRAINFRQCLGARAFGLIRLRIGNRTGELPDNQVEEALIGIVQRPAGRNARDQHRAAGRGALPDGQDQCLMDAIRP